MGQGSLPWEVPTSWQPALCAAREGGLLLLVGATDTGKSTLAAVLAREAHLAGRRTAVVDADVGQASIGPPTCISLGWVTAPITSLADVTPGGLEFVGTPSPMGHLLQCAASTAALVATARRGGAETIVVDTTGMISGSAARALKWAKVKLLDPDLIIALQLEDEVEPLLRPYARRTRPRVLVLRPSPRVRRRTREERSARRQARLARYFAEGQTLEACWDDLPMENTAWTTGRPLPGHLRAHAEELLGCEVLYGERRWDGLFLVVDGRPGEAGLRAVEEVFGNAARTCDVNSLVNRLVGLQGDRGETLGLGILEELDFRSHRLRIYTPLRDLTQVRALRLGSIQVARDGTQLAWNEPGDVS